MDSKSVLVSSAWIQRWNELEKKLEDGQMDALRSTPHLLKRSVTSSGWSDLIIHPGPSSSRQKEREKVSKYFSPMASPKTARGRQKYLENNQELQDRNSSVRWVFDDEAGGFVLVSASVYEMVLDQEMRKTPEVNEFGEVCP